MAGEFDIVPLGEIATVRSGFAFKSSDWTSNGVPVVKIANVKDGRLVMDGCSFVPKPIAEQASEFALQAGDILIAMTGYIGDVAQVRECDLPAVLNQRVGRFSVRDDNRLDKRFLFYLLRDANVRQAIEGLGYGSAQPNVSPTLIHGVEVPLPPPPEQRAIAHILGTLDDKIELNRRMSETLEAMARALFKSWFVDFDPVRAKMEGRWRRGESLPGLPAHLYDLFPDRLVDSELGEIPEGWEVGPLSKFFAVGLGGAWGEDEPSTRATVGVRCLRGIDCHDLAEGRIPDVPVRWVSPKQAADRELTEGTILIEGSGSFCGRSMIWRRAYGTLLGMPVGYSNFCKRLDPRCTAAQAVICWMQMRQAYRDGLLQSFRTGTAFPNFDVHGALSNLIVVVPPAPLAETFGNIFSLSQRPDLMAQSRTLADLRDTLLPKLISGELRVKDAEKFIERATA